MTVIMLDFFGLKSSDLSGFDAVYPDSETHLEPCPQKPRN